MAGPGKRTQATDRTINLVHSPNRQWDEIVGKSIRRFRSLLAGTICQPELDKTAFKLSDADRSESHFSDDWPEVELLPISAATSASTGVVGQELSTEQSVQTNEQILIVSKQTAHTIHHAAATCTLFSRPSATATPFLLSARPLSRF